MEEPVPSKLGIYVSVPFCRAKCSFCNFASGVGSDGALERYVQLLCREIRNARTAALKTGADLPSTADTVYLGGGTPSLLPPHLLREVFTALRQEFGFTHDAEITMEAAPQQIGDALLDEALRMGVNRISLGVQSFEDREAQAVGRSHTAEGCLAEFRRLRSAGIRNLGADLIVGLPYQTEESWRRTLDRVQDAELEHWSVYMLEVDEDSRLGREVLGGGARLHAPAVPAEELVAHLYEVACEVLPCAGYDQYEISNFAASGYRSRHNLKYWTRTPYLGLGLDAHSMLQTAQGEAVRWANPDELGDYGSQVLYPAYEKVGLRAAFEESIFLGLRRVEGVRWTTLRTFPHSWLSELRHGVSALAEAGLMGFNIDRLWLTPRGRLLSGEIFGELLAGPSRGMARSRQAQQ